MSTAYGEKWPYLSPASPGWEWIGGHRGEVRRMLSPKSPDERWEKDPKRVALETLERLNQLIYELQDEILALVAEAYFRGATWSEIARRLDRSKQCVHERYQRQMHAHATHEALRRDLARAWQRARTIQIRGGENDEVAALLAFLQERGRQRTVVRS